MTKGVELWFLAFEFIQGLGFRNTASKSKYLFLFLGIDMIVMG